MSPLHTSSIAPLHGGVFPLPLLPQRSNQQAEATTIRTRYPRFRILDIAVANGILALLVALLVPTFNVHDLILPSTTRSLVDHLRLARTGAASHGTHFRITLQPQTYAIEQLQDQDGNGVWEPDTILPAWNVTLPPTIAIGIGAGTVIEFDARGLITSTSADGTERPITIELRDSQTKKSETIEILSSGKVQRL